MRHGPDRKQLHTNKQTNKNPCVQGPHQLTKEVEPKGDILKHSLIQFLEY